MSDKPILAGAEPFFFEGNNTGVLVIHGFTGTTQSMRFLGEYIANKGFTVLGPRLTGHGTTPEDMEQTSYNAWFTDVEEALAELRKKCDSIFVVGLSMGGALTLYLGEKHHDLAGIIPINAAVDMPEMKFLYDDLKDSDIRFIDGIGSDIQKLDVEELAYKQTPVKSMGEIIELMKLVRTDLNKIKVPTLIFSSIVDNVVPPANSEEIFEKISSSDKTLIPLKHSFHVATLDNDKELIANKTIEFIQRLI